MAHLFLYRHIQILWLFYMTDFKRSRFFHSIRSPVTLMDLNLGLTSCLFMSNFMLVNGKFTCSKNLLQK